MDNTVQNLELADYIRSLWRRKFFILVVTIVAMIGGGVYTLFQPNIYQSTTMLVLFPPKFKTELSPSTFSIHTYKNLLMSPELLQAIIDTLDLNGVSVEKLRPTLQTEIIQEQYGTYQISYSPLILLHVQTHSPVRSRDIANMWANLFLKKMRGLSFKGKEGSLAFITDQFEETRVNLEHAEDRLKDFMSAWRLELLQKELAVKETTLIEYELDLSNVQLNRSSIQGELDQLKEEIGHHTETIVLSKAITDDALWEKVIQDSCIAFSEGLGDFKLKSEIPNPIHQNLQQRIADGRVKLNGSRVREKYLNESIKQTKKQIEQMQKITVEKLLEQRRLHREVENYRKTYGLLAEKAESARLAKAEESEDVKIAARAVEPGYRIGPNRRKSILLSGVFALMVALCLAFFLEYVSR
jgi:uncharacterized protein involved in exopolysaccharide biosynthesis